MESLQLFLFYFMGDGAAPSSWCKAGATTAAQMQAELCLNLKNRSNSNRYVSDANESYFVKNRYYT